MIFKGVWHQVEMDWHPNTERGDDGSDEHDDKQYPFPADQPTWNYFDVLKTFYFRNPYYYQDKRTHPTHDWFADMCQFYTEDNGELVHYVYSVASGYDPSSDKFGITWSGRKVEVDTFEVRYAFSDCYALGWSNLFQPANGTNIGYTKGDSSTKKCGFVSQAGNILHAGNDVVYFAILSSDQSDTQFRQVKISPTGVLPPV